MTQLTVDRPADSVSPSEAASAPEPPLARRRPWVLAIPAVGLVVGSLWFALALPATPSRLNRRSGQLVEELALWRWSVEHLAPPTSGRGLALTLLLGSGLLAVSWAALVALLWRRSPRGATVFALVLVAITATIGVFALPTQSNDIYDYTLFGRVVSHHGGTAYQDVPASYPDDPILAVASRQYIARPDNKLPAWTAATVGVTGRTGDDPVTNLLVMRAFLAACTTATAALVAVTARRLRRGSSASAVVLFGLNPITVSYGASKSDALMVLLLAAAFALLVLGRRLPAVVALTASVLVKGLTAPALFVLLVHHHGPRRCRRFLTGLVAVVVTTAAIYLPFDRPWDLFNDQIRGTRGAPVPGQPLLPYALVITAVGLVLAVLWREFALRHPEALEDDAEEELAIPNKDVLRVAAFALVAAAILLTPPELPWYQMSGLVAVALLHQRAAAIVLGGFSCLSFLIGWWEAIDSRAHPLPKILANRGLVLAIALAVVVLVAWLRAPNNRQRTLAVLRRHRKRPPVGSAHARP